MQSSLVSRLNALAKVHVAAERCVFTNEFLDNWTEQCDPFKPSQVDLERVNQLLNANIKDAKDREALRGKGVSSEGQFIFASLYKTMTDTKWVDKSIVVLDDVEIQPPYLVKNIKSLHEPEATSMHLVKKIVEGAWNKLESERKGG